MHKDLSKKMVIAILFVILIALGGWRVANYRRDNTESSIQPGTTGEETSNSQTEGFDKTQHSIDEPGSIWWIVGKTRPLPEGYVPPDLTVPDVRLRLSAGSQQMQVSDRIASDLKVMFDAAGQSGATLVLSNGYRSYTLQKQFYDDYVARDGQEAADRYSARPGTSEHQTGLAVDITSTGQTCHLEACFGQLPEGRWLAAHAHEYGFIIRYPEGKESVTGYQYEPWHLRYVGKELAAELKRTGQTMEEFFGL